MRQQFFLITRSQCRAGRVFAGLTQTQLAKAAGIGLSTVVDFELDKRAVSDEAVLAIQAALEAAGVEFLPAANGRGVGVAFREEHSNG